MEEDIKTWCTYMHDVDTILFGNQDWIPVLMPEHITNLLKANKRVSPKKKKEKEKLDSDEEGTRDQENGGNTKT